MPTCSIIDKCIKQIRLQKLDKEITLELIRDLERIHENTKNIRALGQEWKTLAKRQFGMN